jgi:hypothetical protein
MVWYGMVWYGMVCYGHLLVLLISFKLQMKKGRYLLFLVILKKVDRTKNYTAHGRLPDTPPNKK